MATTSPDNISYPTNASTKKTIEGHIQDTANSVQTALNTKAASSHNHSATNITSGILDVARGGTGAGTFTSGSYLKGAGTSAITAQSGIPAGDINSGTLSTDRFPTGTIVNSSYMRTNSITSYGYSQSVVIMSALNISITPRYSNSLLVVQWMLTYEADYNSVFRVCRDGSVVGQSGYEGYNPTVSGYWNGYAAVAYDGDRASTPNTHMIQYAIPANSTAATTLQLGIIVSMASGSGAIALNRAWNGNSDAYEAGTSNAAIWEIRQ